VISGRIGDLRYALASLTIDTGEALTAWVDPAPPAQPSTGAGLLTDLYASPVAFFAGKLVGSTQVSQAALDPQTSQGLAARLHLDAPAQTALRVMIAVGVAAAAASVISEQRFYWAVIAVFISFMGANTAGEQVLKAFNRVLGTFVGILIGSLLAQAIGPSTWSLAVILPAVTFGVYFLQVSYALMAMGITIMVAMLYVQLGEYSDSLLAMRLELTALGAVIAMLAALLIFPVRTRRVIRQAGVAYLQALRELVARIPEALSLAPAERRLSVQSRAMDDALMQLLVSSRPLQHDVFRRDELQHNLVLLSSTAHFARNLAATVDEISDVDAAFREPVGAAAADEVELVDRVADAVRDQTGPPPASPPLDAVLDVARRLAAEGVARNDPRRRLLRALVRLDGTVEQLARNLTGRDPAPAATVTSGGPTPATAGQEAG
jgi:uncharacterized membrane protein YccC